MTEKYINIIKKSAKKAMQQKLIIKNGIRYYLIIESDKKPRFKKFKKFNVKKWIFKDVRLMDFKVIDKEEIENIIKKDKKQQQAYDKLFQMSKDTLYILMLSNNQYSILTRFLDKNNIKVGTQIAMTRKGLGFNTRIVFDKILETTPKPKK